MKIKKNHKVTCGSITSINPKRTGYVVNYFFLINGIMLEYNSGCSNKLKLKYESGKKNILIVYEINNPDINRVLEDFDDFEKFSITEQDTLNLNCLN